MLLNISQKSEYFYRACDQDIVKVDEPHYKKDDFFFANLVRCRTLYSCLSRQSDQPFYISFNFGDVS